MIVEDITLELRFEGNKIIIADATDIALAKKSLAPVITKYVDLPYVPCRFGVKLYGETFTTVFKLISQTEKSDG